MEPLGTEFVARSAPSYERTFWDPRSDGQRGIVRTRRVQSFPTNMEIQDNCTLGLQQGLIEGAFLRDMERHGQRVTRPWGFADFQMRPDVDAERPVEVTLKKMRPVQESTNAGGAPTYTIQETGETKTIRTKYLFGCDGGRSSVRRKLEKDHAFTFDGEFVDTLWAALDCVVTSDFPDVRKIAAIHSASHGALYIFPRENNEQGDPIIRCYTQVNMLGGSKNKIDPQDARNKITKEQVMQAIREIAYPYKFEFKRVEWFTCYPIGQRLVSRYSLPAGEQDGRAFPGHRVALCGDACHTHSPKAGQGMNTAIIDSQALSWRVNLVEKGLAHPETLLATYHEERHATGKQLIDFDSEYAALFSGEIPRNQPELAKLTKDELKEHFIVVQRRNAAFTTGAGVVYADNVLNHRDLSRLGFSKGYRVGKLEAGERLQPAWATRWSNSMPVRIIHEIQFDAPGGFRLYICAGDLKRNAASLRALAAYLESPTCFLSKYRANYKAGRLLKGHYNQTPSALNTGLQNGYSHEANPFFHLLFIVQQNRFRFELEDLAELGPLRSMVYADDVEAGGERIGDEDGDESVGGLHRKWGLSGDGGIVVCRPDGYVGAVFPLNEGQKGHDAIEKYFAGFLVPSQGHAVNKL